VIHEPAQQRVGNVAAENFRAIKRRYRLQDPKNFTERLTPIHRMVNGPKIKHGIKGCIACRNVPDVSHPQP